ncbi:MAG TPA: META domain-containing protein [Candidatus Limnocylindrales bacterium]|jgi:heat shock protein HslJ|nr:META domain-containing protein [Candidatus Limnocylindrales bacterium]
MTTRIAAALTAAFFLAACGLVNGSGSDAGIDGEWRLSGGSHAGAPLPLVPAAPITMRLDGDEIGGTAACNHYGGNVDIGDGRIGIGSLAVTEMGCDGPVMESEAAYLAALAAVDRFERRGNSLTLSGEGVELTYAFVPPTPDAALIGPTWLLDGIIEGDAVSSTMGDPATLELHEDGTLSGTTGCRTFDGRYTVSDDGISVSQLANDDRACPGLEVQDEHVLDVIADGFAYEIAGDRLTLTAGDIGLVYRVTDG